MRGLKIAIGVMTVLIVLGVAVIGVTIMRRVSGRSAAHPAAPMLLATTPVLLDEPAGTRIAGIAALPDRLAVQLQGGGPDRIVFLDPRTGAAIGQVSLSAGAMTH